MHAFTQDVPLNAELYQQLRSDLGDERPVGLITHLALELPEGGLRYVDVWESEEHWQKFVEERLHPTVSRFLAERGLPMREPQSTTIHVIDAWT
jgi:hypothetical protein